MIRHFKKGELLFQDGDPSDSVLRITNGKIEILGHHGAQSIVLGHVAEGEFLGEMAAIENRRHSATARAVSDGSAEVLKVGEFFDRVSYDPKTARETVLRLSIRLRQIENRFIAEHSPPGHTAQRVSEADMLAEANLHVTIAAQTDALRVHMGGDAIRIMALPFVVGRVAVAGEMQPLRHPNLLVEDKEPFRLSRDHFMIVRSGSHLLVYDLDSTLGTIVNGRAIGRHFPADTAELGRGENRIVAGGWGSPFEFSVIVD